ncbi:hypothetical protein Tco_1466919, partial [Tanacetum coccineum]
VADKAFCIIVRATTLLLRYHYSIPDEEGPPMEAPAEEAIPELWTLFMDGSSCLEGSGVGLILTSLEYEALVDRNNA